MSSVTFAQFAERIAAKIGDHIRLANSQVYIPLAASSALELWRVAGREGMPDRANSCTDVPLHISLSE